MSKPDYFSADLLALVPQRSSLVSVYDAQAKSADVGFDFADIDIVFAKVQEEFAEVTEAFRDRGKDPAHYAEEIGDCFFALVNLCRHSGLDPEELVRENVTKYLRRCEFIETTLQDESKQWSDISIEEIYQRWRQAKRAGL